MEQEAGRRVRKSAGSRRGGHFYSGPSGEPRGDGEGIKAGPARIPAAVLCWNSVVYVF